LTPTFGEEAKLVKKINTLPSPLQVKIEQRVGSVVINEVIGVKASLGMYQGTLTKAYCSVKKYQPGSI